MTSLELEAWSSLACELTHADAAAIRATGLVDVVAEPEPGRWRLVGDSRIGVAAGPGWEVRVNPRIAVPQLYFLLAYALDPKGWKDQEAGFAAEPRLMDAIANGFSWHALRSVERGLLRGYVRVDERMQAIRGRVRFGDQIARSAALPMPIEVSYDEYTADIAENRILKSATAALLQLHRVPPKTRRRLLKLRAVLDEVAVLPRPREVQMPQFTRLNERYRPALRLAQLVLRASSLDVAAGPVTSVAFVFDMNRVFEDFLSTSLQENLRAHGGEVRLQATARLDVDGHVPIRPDVTWWVQGIPRAVVDAKHKVLEPAGAPNADAYQMLAYCTALGLPRGYLVYAKENNRQIPDLTVRNAECQICVRTVDIGQPPDRLLGQVTELTDELTLAA